MTEQPAPYGGAEPAPDKPARKRVRIPHLREMKQRGEKWAMLTAYDMYAAAVFDEAGIPVLLVGDSASNNVYGNETSLPVTVDELIPLVRAVSGARGGGGAGGGGGGGGGVARRRPPPPPRAGGGGAPPPPGGFHEGS